MCFDGHMNFNLLPSCEVSPANVQGLAEERESDWQIIASRLVETCCLSGLLKKES